MSIAATVIATGAVTAMIMPQASTCRRDKSFAARALVGTGKGSGQKAGREGATLAG